MKEKYFEWEGKVAGLDSQISELEKLGSVKGINYSIDLRELYNRRVKELKRIYKNLTAGQTVQVARHENRPVVRDYLEHMVDDFKELHGDRCFGDDRAIVCGLGKIGGYKVMVIGNNKGHSTKENVTCNFGCANPEGYRKALVKMKFAEKFRIPIVTLIDTPGASPGIGAEERGQAYAIAMNLKYMATCKVPIVSVVIGEGGSGGALGIGVADKLAMLEHSYYSVISPEGCAGILWKDGGKKEEAAKSLRLTSKDNLELKTIDAIIKEPVGGAHRNYHDTINSVKKYVVKSLRGLSKMNVDKMVEKRGVAINRRASGGRSWKRSFKKKKLFGRK